MSRHYCLLFAFLFNTQYANWENSYLTLKITRISLRSEKL